MCCLRNIAMRDYQERVTAGQMPDKVIPICPYALQATQQMTIDNGKKDTFKALAYFPNFNSLPATFS